jgi:hypothetical protein
MLSRAKRIIEVKLRFWTNDISPKSGEVMAKHAWTGGVVRMERNKSHGIDPGNPQVFHSLLDVAAVIEKVLIDHGLVLHASRRMKKYLVA